MGFLKGVGRVLKRVTTPPKDSFLEGVFGDSVLDEVGTAGGFLVGGPAGAAAGRGIGKFAATGDLKKGLQGAAEGYAIGTGAQALGVPGGRGLSGVARVLGRGGPAPGQAVNSALPNVTAGAAPGTTPGGGGLRMPNVGRVLARVSGYFGDEKQGASRLAMLANVAGAGASVYGARQAGQAADQDRGDDMEERAYQRRRQEAYDPYRLELLKQLANRPRGT